MPGRAIAEAFAPGMNRCLDDTSRIGGTSLAARRVVGARETDGAALDRLRALGYVQ